VEESFAFGYGGNIRGAAAVFSVFIAAEGAFHAHPLGNDYFFRVDPFKIRVAMFLEEIFQFFMFCVTGMCFNGH
jgi:hypothetical protein